ncbi:patatin-like phospholipase family protein [Sunxiuqinia sp. sy24]|uniref:patatin-like phospholipase family protein n=1 Tax=Sunxiuqinia sp. sy24 TaxID=3461495 RepID=UPI0040466FA6
MTEPKTIRIGICMAGAVSAGAYTGGVIDYLLETLEHWQRAKDLNLPGVPRHEVKIEVLTGASAGGMTAAISTCALQQQFPAITTSNYKSKEAAENLLFDAWVNLTETEFENMMDQMLDTEDINRHPDHEVKSIFDSSFIEKVASRLIDTTVKDPQVRRPYVAADLEILTTQTNLRGYNYELKFKTALGESLHRMTRHQDLVHFKLTDDGEYGGDGLIPLSFATVEGVNKALLIDAAIATGAFPVGLSPRKVTRPPHYVLDNSFLNNGKDHLQLNTEQDYACVNVDGGVINNEPFGLTDQILERRAKDKLLAEGKKMEARNYELKRSASSFDTTLIMIDPFPSDQGLVEENEPMDAIKFAVPELLNAMRQQLMFKEEELVKAYDEENYTRFMVLPVRYRNNEKQRFPLACGGLGGFAGFFKKEFREHDFLLGRRNCQLFLQRYFSVPLEKNNPILTAGYRDVDRFRISAQEGMGVFLPIIPDMRVVKNPDGTSSLMDQVPEESGIDYDSVKIRLGELLALEDKLEDRFEAVLENIMNGERKVEGADTPSEIVARLRKKSLFKKLVHRVASRVGMRLGIAQAKKIMAAKFIDAVIIELEKRQLLLDDL